MSLTIRHRRRRRSVSGVVALTVGLFVASPAASAIEAAPSTPPVEEQDAPSGLAWDGGAAPDEDDPEVAAAERARLEARSQAAEQARWEREGEGREYRYLPTTPLLREAVKRQREEARRSGDRDEVEVERPPEVPPGTREVVAPRTPDGSRPGGATLFVAVAVAAAAVVAVVRRYG